MQPITRFEALQKVRSCFRTDPEMASFFGVTQPTVWRWLNQSKQMPAEGGHCLRAEQLGVVTKEQLRPDIYPLDHGPNPVWTGVDRRLQGGALQDRPVSFPHNSAPGPESKAAAA